MNPRLAPIAHLLGEFTFPATIADMQAPDCPLIWANQQFYDLVGYNPDAVVGHNCRFLQPDGVNQIEVRRYIRERLADQEVSDATLLNSRLDGSRFLNHLIMKPLGDGLFVGSQYDASDEQAGLGLKVFSAEDQQRIRLLDRWLRMLVPSSTRGA